MGDCIFCKIASGAFNTEFLYEDEDVVAFKDINPKAPVHILVVPKKHYKDLSELDDEKLIAKLFKGVQNVCKKEGITSYRTVLNTGSDAGQEVFHIHIHILAGKKLGDIC